MKTPKFEYTPSWSMEPGYLSRRLLEIRIKQLREKEAKRVADTIDDPFARSYPGKVLRLEETA